MFAIWIWCVYLICRTNLAWSFTLLAGCFDSRENFLSESGIMMADGERRENEIRHHEIIEILWNVRHLFEFSFCHLRKERQSWWWSIHNIKRQFMLTVSTFIHSSRNYSKFNTFSKLKLSLVLQETKQRDGTRRNCSLKYARALLQYGIIKWKSHKKSETAQNYFIMKF